MKLVIKGSLPTLNKYINAERTNRFIAAKMKKEATELVAWQCKGLDKITSLADYTFTWYTPNKRSDPDNIAFGAKFVFDGMQAGGILPNDSLKYVRSITHFFETGDQIVEVQVDET